jgi:hypothetical protein
MDLLEERMWIVEGRNIRIGLKVFIWAESSKSFDGSISNYTGFTISAPLIHYSNKVIIFKVRNSLGNFRSVDSSVKISKKKKKI